MINNSAQDAVSAALRGDWESAIKINEAILTDNENDVEALNRLARAYSETGNFVKAKQIAKSVLKIDPFNTIASKCLQKWLLSKKAKSGNDQSGQTKRTVTFLEEPGKTKITSLINLGSSKTLASLDTGDSLRLNAHKHKVSATTMDGEYVGKLADDVSARIRNLIKSGYEYDVLVKSVDPPLVRVFIKEAKRPDKYTDAASFAPEKIDYISFTPPELVHKKDILEDTEE